jgi:hypothetical protein
VRLSVDKMKPSPQAIAVGRKLAVDPPPGYQDRYSVHGWACLVEAVWAAEAALDGVADRKAEAPPESARLQPVGEAAEATV